MILCYPTHGDRNENPHIHHVNTKTVRRLMKVLGNVTHTIP